jgi:putative transposase
MKQTKYPVERVIQILSEAELPGNSIAEVCRKYSVSRSAFDKWKQKFKGMSSNDAKRLKVLEDENMRLKRILAEKELEIQVLRDIVKKNF